MLSTPHLLVGATLGSISPNPIVALLFGFLSHFLMDRVPHWDWRPINFKLWLYAFLEFLFGAGLLFYLTKNSTDPFLIWAGAIGGVLPDVLSVPYNLLNLKVRVLEPLDRFHNLVQRGNQQYPMFARISLQIVTVILTSYFLLR